MVTVEDVDLADPPAGHEETLSLPELGDAEPLDVLYRRGEPAQMRSKRLALGCVRSLLRWNHLTSLKYYNAFVN